MRKEMDIWRGSPVRELFGVTSRLNRFFDDWMEPHLFEKDPWSGIGESTLENLHETPDHYLLSVDLPGISRENLDVELQGNQIRIFAERKWQDSSQNKNQRRFGRYEKTFILPENANLEELQANFQNGVLELAIPKIEAAPTKKIQIREEKEGFFSRFLEKAQKGFQELTGSGKEKTDETEKAA